MPRLIGSAGNVQKNAQPQLPTVRPAEFPPQQRVGFFVLFLVVDVKNKKKTRHVNSGVEWTGGVKDCARMSGMRFPKR